MTTYFGKQTLHDAFKVVPGLGFITVDIPFVPDYIKVDFHGPALSPKEELMGDDRIFWDLVTVSANSYQINIGWETYTTRQVYYRIAKLTVDPV